MRTTTRDQELSVRLAKTPRFGRAYRQPRRLGTPSTPESPDRPSGDASVHRLDGRRRNRR